MNNWSGRNEYIARDDQLAALVRYGEYKGADEFNCDGIKEAVRDGLIEGGQRPFRDLVVHTNRDASAKDVINEAMHKVRHHGKGVHRRV